MIDDVVCILYNHIAIVGQLPFVIMSKQSAVVAAIDRCGAVVCVTGKVDVRAMQPHTNQVSFSRRSCSRTGQVDLKRQVKRVVNPSLCGAVPNHAPNRKYEDARPHDCRSDDAVAPMCTMGTGKVNLA